MDEPFATGERRDRPHLILVSAGFGHLCYVLFAPGRLVETVVVHVPLVAGPDVLQKPEEELLGRKRDGLVLSIAIVLVSERDAPAVIGNDPPLRERRPAGVSAAVGGGL